MKIHFLEEIIVEILIRLSVQFLLRFKCASKSWNTLITSNYFKAKHFNHAKKNKKILIARLHYGTISCYCSSLSSAQPLQKFSGFPLNYYPKRRYEIICCCDGLSLVLYRDGYLLWNPSTNESMLLPNPEFRHTYKEAFFCTYGFGYDSISDDYKILKIDNDGGNDFRPCSNILALKSDSWRKIDKHPRAFHNGLRPDDSLAFVRGAFHWISKDDLSNYFVISFNISNEVYIEISLPHEICNIPNMRLVKCVVSVIHEMLCAYCTCQHIEGSTFKLWVMKDYGIKESWTQLFTIQKRVACLYYIILEYMFADGDVLLLYSKCFSFGFRTFKGPFRLFTIYHGDHQRGFVYKKSLIPLKLLI